MTKSLDSSDENYMISVSEKSEKSKESSTEQQRHRPISSDHNSYLWVDKYAPKEVVDLAVNKKKVGEFMELLSRRELNGRPSTQILILLGPSGCGKNALLKTFCEQENI